METRKKSEPQIGFEPTILRDLVGFSNPTELRIMFYLYKRLTWWLDGCIYNMP